MSKNKESPRCECGRSRAGLEALITHWMEASAKVDREHRRILREQRRWEKAAERQERLWELAVQRHRMHEFKSNVSLIQAELSELETLIDKGLIPRTADSATMARRYKELRRRRRRKKPS